MAEIYIKLLDMTFRQGPTSVIWHLFCILKACGDGSKNTEGEIVGSDLITDLAWVSLIYSSS